MTLLLPQQFSECISSNVWKMNFSVAFISCLDQIPEDVAGILQYFLVSTKLLLVVANNKGDFVW